MNEGFKEYLIEQGYTPGSARTYAETVRDNEIKPIRNSRIYALRSALKAYRRFLGHPVKPSPLGQHFRKKPISFTIKYREFDEFERLKISLTEAGYKKTTAYNYVDFAKSLTNFTNKSLKETTEEDIMKFLETKKDITKRYFNSIKVGLKKVLLLAQGKEIPKNKHEKAHIPIVKKLERLAPQTIIKAQSKPNEIKISNPTITEKKEEYRPHTGVPCEKITIVDIPDSNNKYKGLVNNIGMFNPCSGCQEQCNPISCKTLESWVLNAPVIPATTPSTPSSPVEMIAR